MPAKLIVESLIDNSRQEFPFDKARLTIGRKPGNDLYFNRPEVSGTHAAFLNEDEKFFVMDLNSTNGTLLNGAQLAANSKYPFTDQDIVTINPFKISLEATKDIGATMMEMASDRSSKRGGTILDLGGKVSTGTDPGPIESLPESEAAPAENPEPAEAPPQAPPKEEPAPSTAPVDSASSAQPQPAEGAVEEPKSKLMGILLWLIVGGVFLLLALALIVFLLTHV
jgi:predicted component of type VI protein secretion system